MLVHSTYWAIRPTSFYDTYKGIQDHQHVFRWGHVIFQSTLVSLLIFEGLHLYLTVSSFEMSWVLSRLPSLSVRGFIDSQYSWEVCIIYFIKCFKDLSCLFYGELNILFYSEFFIWVKTLYFSFMNFINFLSFVCLNQFSACSQPGWVRLGTSNGSRVPATSRV